MYYFKEFSLYFLTFGASLLLGLLSFGGFYVIWPIWPLAIGAFFLSVIYEAQIFKSTIDKAFKKIAKAKFSAKQMIIASFSIIAAVLMTIGSTFLLAETISAIPLFAGMALFANPFLIIGLAALGGIAYGLLTYNALHSFVMKNKLAKTWKKLKEDFKEKKFFSAIATVIFVVLTIGLTICTAGTWLTIARHGKSAIALFNKLPFIIMGILQPIFTGIASLAFNLQNILKSMQFIAKNITSEKIKLKFNELKASFNTFIKNSNIMQIINPFNILVLCIKQPLRILAFLGHLVSIALTADRVPGISPIYSAILGFTNEFIEDLHFFFHDESKHEHKHEHKHEKKHEHKKCNHDHQNDIPSKIINAACVPFEYFSKGWHRFFNTSEQKNDDASQQSLQP